MSKQTRAESRERRHRSVRKNITGSPEKPRLSVFRSLAEIYAQVIDDEAERMTITDYLNKGYFGGKSKVVSGVVVGRTYYPFGSIKQKFVDYLISIKFGVKKAK